MAGASTHNDRDSYSAATTDKSDLVHVVHVQDHDVDRTLPPTKENGTSNLHHTKDGQEERPYSVFTRHEKWAIVAFASIGGVFSTLTANSYFPAIPAIASAFGTSIELINVTVTVYMVVQGVSPMIWGTLGDRWGRRPMFLACLFILSLSCVGIALTPTNAYWLLTLLRCLQAAGSASTIALGAGVIADVATASERAGFFGFYGLGPMLGPCLGPVIGGVLAQFLGWRSIFWFLSISSACCFIVMLLYFPETLRALVGDGSIPPSTIHRAIIPIIGRKRWNHINTERPLPKRLMNPLRLLLFPDVAILLFFNGIIYSVFYGVTASLSILFETVYPFLDQTDVGLIFLAFGGGMIVGSVIHGKWLDREYRIIKEQMIAQVKVGRHPSGQIDAVDVTKDEHFPIELARLRSMPVFLAVYTASCIGYGWCLESRVNIAVPLILQVLLGYTVMAIMNTTQTLIVDLVPTLGSSITACNNLVRCSLGAACVSVIQLVLDGVGMGWTYVILGGLSLVVSPLVFVVMRFGPRWRAGRRSESTQT